MLEAKTSEAQKGLLQNDYVPDSISSRLHEKRKHMLENLRKRLGIGQVDDLGRPLEQGEEDGG